MAIESADYEATRVRLMADPTVQAMAASCRANRRAELCSESGTPEHGFMLACLREYHKRTGRSAECHIGGIAEAILRLLDLPGESWPATTAQQMTLDAPPRMLP